MKNNSIRNKTVLVLAPHTDDGELGCGATLSKMIRNNYEIYYAAFSSCKESLPSGYAENTLIDEMFNATSKLGIKKDNVKIFDFPVRNFESYRQSILDEIIKLNKEINPSIIFSPSSHDIHQDHATIAKECLRAFKTKTILQYEEPWNNYSFDNQLFVCVDEVDVLHKFEALCCYKTQSNRPYTQKDFVEGLLLTHGVQAGTKFAEVFEIPRMIIKDF